jgi:hypothetical protein
MDATSSLSPKLTRETPSSKKIQKFPPNHNQDAIRIFLNKPKARSYSLRVRGYPLPRNPEVPIPERVDPERDSYILLILPVGIRTAGGQYSADEAHEIAKTTRGWDWRLDENQRPRCLPRLEALLTALQESSTGG